MDDLTRLWRFLCLRWWAVVLPALLLAGTGVLPLLQRTPLYRIERTVLLTSRAPMNETGDTLGYDFPAISRSPAYRENVAALAGVSVADVAAMLSVRNADRALTFTVTGSDPAQLLPIRDAAVAVLVRDGTLLWGNTSGQTAVNVAELGQVDTPQPVAVWRDQLVQLFLRAVAGALVGLLYVTFRGVQGETAHAHQ